MASSWSSSWGISWGNSWGVVQDTPVDAKPLQGYYNQDEELLEILIPLLFATCFEQAA